MMKITKILLALGLIFSFSTAVAFANFNPDAPTPDTLNAKNNKGVVKINSRTGPVLMLRGSDYIVDNAEQKYLVSEPHTEWIHDASIKQPSKNLIASNKKYNIYMDVPDFLKDAQITDKGFVYDKDGWDYHSSYNHTKTTDNNWQGIQIQLMENAFTPATQAFFREILKLPAETKTADPAEKAELQYRNNNIIRTKFITRLFELDLIMGDLAYSQAYLIHLTNARPNDLYILLNEVPKTYQNDTGSFKIGHVQNQDYIMVNYSYAKPLTPEQQKDLLNSFLTLRIVPKNQ